MPQEDQVVEKDEYGEPDRFAFNLQGDCVAWDDVIGLEEAKDAIKEAVIDPVKFPNMFPDKRKQLRGILLYGPPGSGKSYLAKAIATEVAGDATFLSVSSCDLVGRWVGVPEKLITELFSKARDCKPSIIFIDEIDLLSNEVHSETGRRIKMQDVYIENSNVLVLGATNIPWVLDSDILRRFENRIYISLPKASERTMMIKNHLGTTRHTLTEQDFDQLGRETPNYSGADISIVVRDAFMMPIRKAQSATHFKKVIVPSNEDLSKKVTMYTPCSPDDESAEKMSWIDIGDGQLYESPITMNDLQKSLLNNKPTVDEVVLAMHRSFTD